MPAFRLRRAGTASALRTDDRLRQAATAPASSTPLNALMMTWFGSRASGVSLTDRMYAYFQARSGLPARSTLSDHMNAYYSGAVGRITANRSVTDLEIAFWQAVDPANNTGSWADRARKFYAS